MKQVIIGVIIFSMMSTGFMTTIVKSDKSASTATNQLGDTAKVSGSGTTNNVISDSSSVSISPELKNAKEYSKAARDLPAIRQAAGERFRELYFSVLNNKNGQSNPQPLPVNGRQNRIFLVLAKLGEQSTTNRRGNEYYTSERR